MEFFESKKVEAYLMFREAGLNENDLEFGETFFYNLLNGTWTSFEDYKKHFYNGFALFKILESISMGVNIKEIKRIILNSQTGVSFTLMQDLPVIFANLNPLFLKLNEKYVRLNKVIKVISMDRTIEIDPTSDTSADLELVFKQLENLNKVERNLAYIAITEIIEHIMNMITPFQDQRSASLMRDLFKFVKHFNFFSIYEAVEKKSKKDEMLTLENKDEIATMVKVSETKGEVNILKAKMQTIEYNINVLVRNYNDGLISDEEYQMRAVKLKNERLHLQQKIFSANINLIKDMADSF